MDVQAADATVTTALSSSGIPPQRASDAFTAYASVHELGIALQRARLDDAPSTA